MEAKELRIGNLVTDKFYEDFKTIIEVESISDKGINLMIEDDGRYPEVAQTWIEPEYRLDTIFPIPLTEEWLEKFGYRFNKDEIVITLDEGWAYLIIERDFSYSIQSSRDASEYACLPGKTCKHVHQLQNLYFALTGKELDK